MIKRLRSRMEEEMECEKENVAPKRTATKKLLNEIHGEVTSDLQAQKEWELAKRKRKKLSNNKKEKEAEEVKRAQEDGSLIGGKNTTLVSASIALQTNNEERTTTQVSEPIRAQINNEEAHHEDRQVRDTESSSITVRNKVIDMTGKEGGNRKASYRRLRKVYINENVCSRTSMK